VFEKLKKNRVAFKGRSIPVAVLLIVVVLLSAGSGLYAGSFFAQQAPNVTITTTIYTTQTSWTTSTIWSTLTETVQGVLTIIEFTTSTNTVTITGPDSNTMLLLHMDGTDGSQTFVDSSLKAHSVTAKGNAQIDTAQSKFGSASGLFDGTGDYLSTPDSADWTFGTGDFTIDFWVRFNALPAAGAHAPFWEQFVNDNNQLVFGLYNDSGTYKWRLIAVTGGAYVLAFAIVATVAVNTWYHVALVRSGTSFYVFQGGTQVGTTVTDSDAWPDIAAQAQIGAYRVPISGEYLNGWLDEFRVSKGVARWTSNFTPPAAPY
jgi:hypothetical protein